MEALQTIDIVRHLPLSGHSDFVLQLAWYLVGLGGWACWLFIVAFDDTWHVWHATVSEFDIEFIANLVEPVASGKAFVNTVEELFAVIRFNFNVYVVHVVRGIKPGSMFMLFMLYGVLNLLQ